MRARRASSFADLGRASGRLASEVEDALWELTAAGLVTADGFENLRALIDPRRRRGEGRESKRRPRHAAGRWALVTPSLAPISAEERTKKHAETLRISTAKAFEELWKNLLAGAEKDCVGMRKCFVRKRSHMQSAKADECATTAVAIGNTVGAICVRNVDLYDNEVRRVVERQRFYVLVLNDGAIIRCEICGQCRQAQRREKRVLNWPPIGIGCLSECRKDELDVKRSRSPRRCKRCAGHL